MSCGASDLIDDCRACLPEDLSAPWWFYFAQATALIAIVALTILIRVLGWMNIISNTFHTVGMLALRALVAVWVLIPLCLNYAKYIRGPVNLCGAPPQCERHTEDLSLPFPSLVIMIGSLIAFPILSGLAEWFRHSFRSSSEAVTLSYYRRGGVWNCDRIKIQMVVFIRYMCSSLTPVVLSPGLSALSAIPPYATCVQAAHVDFLQFGLYAQASGLIMVLCALGADIVILMCSKGRGWNFMFVKIGLICAIIGGCIFFLIEVYIAIIGDIDLMLVLTTFAVPSAANVTGSFAATIADLASMAYLGEHASGDDRNTELDEVKMTLLEEIKKYEATASNEELNMSFANTLEIMEKSRVIFMYNPDICDVPLFYKYWNLLTAESLLRAIITGAATKGATTATVFPAPINLDANGLNPDERAAILAYTFATPEPESPARVDFYGCLNYILSTTRTKEKYDDVWVKKYRDPLLPYLRLLYRALEKLPAEPSGVSLFRGIKGMCSNDEQGRLFAARFNVQGAPAHVSRFTSTSPNIQVATGFALDSDAKKLLGPDQVLNAALAGVLLRDGLVQMYTLSQLDAPCAFEISCYSFVPKEEERLMLPDVQFYVTRELQYSDVALPDGVARLVGCLFLPCLTVQFDMNEPP